MYTCHMCIHIYTYIHTPYVYILVYMSDTSWAGYRDFSAQSYHFIPKILEADLWNSDLQWIPCSHRAAALSNFWSSRMAAWHLTGGPARCCHGPTIGIQTSHCSLASANCMGLYTYIYHVRYPGIFVCTVSKTYRISHFMEFLNYDDPQYNGQYNNPRIINQLALKLRGHEFSLWGRDNATPILGFSILLRGAAQGPRPKSLQREAARWMNLERTSSNIYI